MRRRQRSRRRIGGGRRHGGEGGRVATSGLEGFVRRCCESSSYFVGSGVQTMRTPTKSQSVSHQVLLGILGSLAFQAEVW